MHHYRHLLPCAVCLATLLWSGHAPAAAPGADACAPLRRLCRAAGFVQGGASSGVGLRDDCMEPLEQGIAQPPNARLPLPAVDPSLLAQCRGSTTLRTRSRYGLEGTDLGYSFEHQGKLYFLFGDTVGVERGRTRFDRHGADGRRRFDAPRVNSAGLSDLGRWALSYDPAARDTNGRICSPGTRD
jgi:hypothetical protein